MIIVNTPHNPVRFADTIGLVMERPRPEDAIGKLLRICRAPHSYDRVSDRLRWYCKSGKHAKPTIIREETLHVTDLGTQLKPIIQRWMENEELCKCAACGAIAEAK